MPGRYWGHYEALGVPRSAPEAEVRKAYLRQALRHHPDKDAAVHATERFQRIQEAYEVLSSPTRRRAYDLGAQAPAVAACAPTRPLIEACRCGDPERVDQLLRSGEPVDGRDSTGRTPLMLAAKRSCCRTLELLLEARADVRAANCAGWTALFFAVGADHEVGTTVAGGLTFLGELLAARAEPNATTSYGVTPLMLSCAAGNVPATQRLMDADADPHRVSDIGMSALVFASDRGHVLVLQLLLQACVGVNVTYGNGKTALMSASALAFEPVVSELLAAQADPNASTGHGYTALIYAVEHSLADGLACPASNLDKPRAVAVARLLLHARADVTTLTQDGKSPLGLAVASEDLAMATSLLEAGADPAGHDACTSHCMRRLLASHRRERVVPGSGLPALPSGGCWHWLALLRTCLLLTRPPQEAVC